MNARECPSEDSVVRFLLGKTKGGGELLFEAHIDQCEDCRRLLAALVVSLPERSHDAEALTTEMYRPLADATRAEALAEGSAIGRFVVVELLGAGGTGTVYAAYDPELDRTIALKLLRDEEGGDRDEGVQELIRTRLLREAQATARLQHENVVAVHDIGAIGRHVFMAMELVDGQTLREWMRSEVRSWREVVSLFRQAGEGLAAAHAAGLAHGDFKPENILIDRKRRVRVGDFGLARSIAVSMPGDERGAERPAGEAVLVAGTPAYMAPECLRGGPADARSDQFAFCVALHEALCGVRPFRGHTIGELKSAIAAGPARPPRSLPRHLRRLLARGLAASPAERHSSMKALLEKLSHDPRARLRRLAVAATVAVAGIAVGTAILTEGAVEDVGTRLCARAGDPIRDGWNPVIRADIAAAFGGSGRPYAGRAAAAVQAALDRYARSWVDMRTEACQATHVRGAQSTHLLDLRNICLDDRLAQLEALGRLLGRADAATVDKAVEAANNLPDLAGCADAEGLRARVPPPAERDRRAEWESLRARVAEARALHDSGSFEPALALIAEIQPRVERLGFAPLTGELFELRGGLEDRLGRGEKALASLDRAAVEAEAGGDDATKGRAWILAAQIRATSGGAADQVDRLLAQARAASTRLGRDRVMEMRVESAMGQIALERGLTPDALTHYRRSSELAEAAFGAGHVTTARSRLNLIAALDEMEQDDEALAIVRPTIATLEAELGRGHPDIAQAQVLLADILMQKGLHDQALAIYREAVRSFEALYGPVHRTVWTVLNAIGAVYMAQEKYAEALVELRRALEIVDQSVGRRHRSAALLLGNIGMALFELGRLDEGLASCREAISIANETLGPDSQFAARAQQRIAEALMTIRPRAALHAAQEAVRMLQGSVGQGHPEVSRAMLTQAQIHVALGQRTQALRAAEKAHEILVAALGKNHPETAATRAWLGSTSYDFGRDRRRARAMVEEAHAIFVAAAGEGDEQAKAAAEQAAAWLKSHR
jgi:tetratricopeptide (TPR) repeat protein